MFKKCDCFKDKVKCETCKHWIDKEDAQEVVGLGSYSRFYCPLCRVPYDEIHFPSPYDLGFVNHYYKIIPEKTIEVDPKTGKEIKNK